VVEASAFASTEGANEQGTSHMTRGELAFGRVEGQGDQEKAGGVSVEELPMETNVENGLPQLRHLPVRANSIGTRRPD
jgi:hypothetical protein